MAGSRRKDKPVTDVDRLIKNHIEERNYLLFTLTDRKPSELEQIMKWSLEGLYQFLYANNIHSRKLDDMRKNAESKAKTRNK